jgi:CRP-like cAMP-binding protein
MNSNSEKPDPQTQSEFQDNINLLRETPFFSALPLEVVKLFAYLCTREVFKPGQYLLQQDDDDGCAFYIIEGKTVLTRSNQGNEEELRTFEAGMFFGSISLITRMPRLFSLKAVEEVTGLMMTRAKFTKASEQFPDIMPRLIRSIAERITMWEKKYIIHHASDLTPHKDNIGISLI